MASGPEMAGVREVEVLGDQEALLLLGSPSNHLILGARELLFRDDLDIVTQVPELVSDGSRQVRRGCRNGSREPRLWIMET